MRASTSVAAPAAVPGSWRETYRQRLFRHEPADRDPVTLRHRRIYILPTKRGLAFLATLAMALLTSLNYSLSLGFGTTFLLAGLVAASLIHTFRNLSGIELRPLAAGETFAGSVMPFSNPLSSSRRRPALQTSRLPGQRSHIATRSPTAAT